MRTELHHISGIDSADRIAPHLLYRLFIASDNRDNVRGTADCKARIVHYFFY